MAISHLNRTFPCEQSVASTKNVEAIFTAGLAISSALLTTTICERIIFDHSLVNVENFDWFYVK